MIIPDPADLTGAASGWGDQVRAAASEYDALNQHYDEVFVEVSERLAARRSAGKTDIAVLTFWKRSAQGAWVKDFLDLPEGDVRRATGEAFEAADDAGALGALDGMPGFQSWGAMATAVLCAYDPQRWAVMDWRAHRGLNNLDLGVGDTRRGRTVRYLKRVRAMRDALDMMGTSISCRDIDKALFVLGGR